jgi:hypothetical protein
MNIVNLTSNTLVVKIYSKAKINYFVLAILIILLSVYLHTIWYIF